MTHDWFSPARRVKPSWQYRIGVMLTGLIGTWGFFYLFTGRSFALVGTGIMVLQFVVFFILLNLLDPILRARLRARFRRKV
jgi:hypothetical protein